eukprot:2257247-Pleurochrysis_carterae.AAC.4
MPLFDAKVSEVCAIGSRAVWLKSFITRTPLRKSFKASHIIMATSYGVLQPMAGLDAAGAAEQMFA